jgi:Tfp pilus assembly protein PilV
MLKKSAGVTLIELVIAIVLVSLAILGLSNIDIFGHSQALDASRRTKLQNEVTIALDHMTKEISNAIGDANTFPVDDSNFPNLIKVRVDSTLNGRFDAADGQISYGFNSGQITFTDTDGSSEIIASRIANFIPSLSSNYYLNLQIRSCWTPASASDIATAPTGTTTNPCVVMSTNIRMPSVAAN